MSTIWFQQQLSASNKLNADYIQTAEDFQKVSTSDKQTWNNKQDKLTAGANISISADNVISATGSAAGIADVKIEGTSIVSGDTANIPKASSSLGVVKSSNSTTGIIIDSNGEVRVDPATYSDVDSRDTSDRPLTVGMLDYAVKASLSDSLGPTFTDAEKTAAKTRLGIVDGITYTAGDNISISASNEISAPNMVKSITVTALVKLTQAEYDALTTKDPNTMYIII